MEHIKREYIEPNDPNSFCKIPDGPVILDFTGCKPAVEFHLILKERFGLPDYYGENWDALWDCLQYFTDEPLTVKIRGLRTLPEECEGLVQGMLGVFKDVHELTPNIVFECE